ncbi:MAG: integrase family protein [Bradyrhizobium sp.]|nr:integrase family protein [Bradyrhizobium sp.]
MNVHALPSLALSNARLGMDALIAKARSLPVFGPTVDFDAPVWDLAPVKPARPTAGSAKVAKLYFTTHENGSAKGIEGRTLLAPKFAAFVKALIVLREQSNPRGPKDHNKLLRAARSLHDVLANRDHDPIAMVSSDFKRAAEAIDKANAATTKYRLGQALEEIAEAVNRHNVAKTRILFSNPFPRVTYDTTRISEEARSERAERMATPEAIDALACASAAVREKGYEPDLLLVAATEMLICAPWRINDALNVQVDCDRREAGTTEGSPERLGFAYRGSKGVTASIKWIPSEMKEMAERALADIRRITEPARTVARFMEDHPGRAWLPDPWRLADPETAVSKLEVAEMLGMEPKSATPLWLERHDVRPIGLRGRSHLYRLGDVEAAILKQQPALPPGAPPLSSYLFIVPRHFFNTHHHTTLPIVTFVNDQNVSDFIAGRPGMPSVFERLELKDERGEPYAVRSHGIRHFLNTLAQEGGLSQLDIARWSGRKDVRENAAYDHTGGVHLGRKMREILDTGAMRGPIAETIEKLPAVERKAFLESRLATVHMTDIGACIQDWNLAPCPKHGSCATCGDHLIIKGNAKQRERAERLLQDYEPIVAEAETEKRDGTYGVGPWVDHNRKIVDGLRQVIAIHDDASIPDGTPVQARSP